MSEKVIVIGASPNFSRFSHRAVKRLRNSGYNVIAIGNKTGMIDDVEIIQTMPLEENVYSVVLYIGPQHQKSYYDYIVGLKPQNLYFNPGTYNKELEDLAKENKINIVEGCTLAALTMGDF